MIYTIYHDCAPGAREPWITAKSVCVCSVYGAVETENDRCQSTGRSKRDRHTHAESKEDSSIAFKPCKNCCCNPTACICCNNCSDDVVIASAPMNGFIGWGGFVINEVLDVNDVAFCASEFDWDTPFGKPTEAAVGVVAVPTLPFTIALRPFGTGLVGTATVPLKPMPAVAAAFPLMVDNRLACICWIFFCSFSFCVSANFTTNGAEHPSIVWLWWSA